MEWFDTLGEPSDVGMPIKPCRPCDDDTRNRHAWGLLLVESEITGKYIRVGAFTSRARASEAQFFRRIRRFLMLRLFETYVYTCIASRSQIAVISSPPTQRSQYHRPLLAERPVHGSSTTTSTSIEPSLAL